MNRRIVAGLAAASVSAAALPARAQAQDAVITGRVTNASSGQGISGVTIAIPELGAGTLTNDVGNYTLSVPAARVRGQSVALQARFIGYRRRSVTVTLAAGRTTQNFTLEADANRLTEVVVTGVSVATERVKVPFAVTRVDSTSTPVVGVNPLAQIQGKVPGANIVSASGRPGTPPSVLLRGPKSINSTGRSQEPLYVVDGVILNGTIADINATEIESLEVVKGAAAASLYGSQAANGVIQITTKRGRMSQNGVKFGLRSEYGASDIERSIGIAQRHGLLMDPTQTRFCINNGLSNATGVSRSQAQQCQRTVDWLQENLRINDNTFDYATATTSMAIDLGSAVQGNDTRRLFQTNPWPGANYNAVQQFVQAQPLALANLDMTAKFGATDIFASANTTQQGGAIAYLNGYKRNSIRLNANQQVGNPLQLSLNTFFSRSAADGFNQEGGGTAFFRLTRTPPIVDLARTDSRGRLFIRPNLQGGGAQNENALYSLQNVGRLDINSRYLGNFRANYTPVSWFAADASLGYDNLNQNGRGFTNRGFRTTGPNPSTQNNGSLQNYAGGQESVNGSAGIAFPNVKALPDLLITPTARVQYLQQDNNFRFASGSQLAVSNVEDLQNSQQAQLTAQAIRQSTRQLTYQGGLQLEYKERYILTADARRDGNSTFGAGQRWATYGRVAGNWIASNEPFFRSLQNTINLLKFTANYGTSGLQPSFAAQYETYTLGTGGTLTPLTLGNQQLRPQKTGGSEFGLELGAFNSVNFTATYALDIVRDQILPVPLAAAQGFQQQWQNAGTVQNKTVELGLTFPLLKTRGLDWTGRVQYDRTINKITSLKVPPFFVGGNTLVAQNTGQLFKVAEGEPIGSFYGRKFATSCNELPASFAAQCGVAGGQYQRNNDGLIVWTGGRELSEGYTNNLWNATLPAAQTPYPKSGYNFAWGHPITLRDTATGVAQSINLGQALPKFRWSASSNLAYKRFSAYGLIDAAVGQSVYNQSRQWSYLDFLSRDQDQTGKDVGDVKPQSYYYRSQENPAGIGGLYDVLGAPLSFFTEKASFAKVREVQFTYRVGKVVGFGDWTFGVTGRNLQTWTNYRGFDPEVGLNPTPIFGFQSAAGSLGSGAITAVDAFSFPNPRTFSFNLSTRF